MLLHEVNSEENKKDGEMFDFSTNNFCQHLLPNSRTDWGKSAAAVSQGCSQQMGCFTGLTEPDFAPCFYQIYGVLFFIWHFSFHVPISSLDFYYFSYPFLYIIVITPGINCILALWTVFCLCCLNTFLERGRERLFCKKNYYTY